MTYGIPVRPVPAFTSQSASFSPCGTYRYSLRRSWVDGNGSVLFLMLNPSTADATVLDPTVRKCVVFAHAWGFQRMAVANIFAYRATNPRDMYRVKDPIGPDNTSTIIAMAREASQLVVAWGVNGDLAGRGRAVSALLASERIDAKCFATTKAGHPVHPLYQPYETVLRSWRGYTERLKGARGWAY